MQPWLLTCMKILQFNSYGFGFSLGKQENANWVLTPQENDLFLQKTKWKGKFNSWERALNSLWPYFSYKCAEWSTIFRLNGIHLSFDFSVFQERKSHYFLFRLDLGGWLAFCFPATTENKLAETFCWLRALPHRAAEVSIHMTWWHAQQAVRQSPSEASLGKKWINK